MSIQSVRTLSTSTYQSFSAYMTVRQQKVATVALIIVGCLVTLFACYWHCFGTKKKKVQADVGNDVENNNAQAPVNKPVDNMWQAHIDKMEQDQQKIKDLVVENQRLQLNLQRMLNTPIQQLVNQPLIAPMPAPVPQFVAPAPVVYVAPPQAAAFVPMNIAFPQAVTAPALPELLAHLDTAINHLSDLEKSMNQRGVATDQVGLADIISNYSTQIKPALVHPLHSARDVQLLKWKDMLEVLKEAKKKLMFCMAVDGKIVYDKDKNEIHLMTNCSKAMDPVYCCLAEGYYLPGRYKEVVEIADKIVHDVESKESYFIKVANSYYHQGQLKEAVDVAEKIHRNTKFKETCFDKIAEAYCQKDQLKEAVDVLEKIHSDKEIKEKGLVKVADAYCQKDQLKESVDVLEKIHSDKKSKEKVLVKVADAYCQKDQLKEAVGVLEKINSGKEGKEKGLIKVADAHYQKKELKEAVGVLEKIWNDKAGKEKGYVKIAWAYYQKNQLKDALDVLDKIWSDKKAKDECLVKIAEDCYKKGNRKDALEVINKVSLNYDRKAKQDFIKKCK